MIKIDNIPLGLGLIPGAPRKKCFWGALIGAGASLIGSAISGSQQHSYTKEQQRLQSKLNKEEMAYSTGLQRSQQEWMMNNMYGKQVSGMRNAGLNPATANGTTPATPSGGTPTTGPSGPSAGMANLDLAGAIKNIELLDAQKKNIDADTKNKDAQTSNVDADTVIKTWQGSPQYQKLVEQGLSADAAKSWADANLSDAKSFEAMASVQKLFSSIRVDESTINNLQASTARTYVGIQEALQGMKESEARIELHRACAKAQRAAAVEHYAGANLKNQQALTEGHVRKKLDSEANLNDQHRLESGYRTTGQKIDNVVKEYYSEVLQHLTPEQRAQLEATDKIERILLPAIPRP